VNRLDREDLIEEYQGSNGRNWIRITDVGRKAIKEQPHDQPH
jgi:hypothetical protein